jgi:site-specific recombinase XerD
MKEPGIRSKTSKSGKKVYYLDYYTPDGVRHRPTVGTRKDDATKARAKVYHDLISGKFDLPADKSARLSLTDLVDLMLKSKADRNADTTISKYRAGTDHLLSFFKNSFPSLKAISRIKQVHLEEHIQDYKRSGHQNSTVNGQIRLLKILFNFAVDSGYLNESPARKLQKYQVENADKVEFWSKVEVVRILAEVKPCWRDPLEFLYHTGLRKAELINLTWDDVREARGNMSIAIQPKPDWHPKTHQCRVIPLNTSAAAIIRRQTKAKKHKYIFKGPKGGKVHHDRIYVDLKRTLKEIGLIGDVHKFRHTFASHLAMSGVGIESVSKLMGHSSIAMTMKYAHLSEDHLQAGVEKLTL